MKYARRLKRLADDQFIKALDRLDEPGLISFSGGFPETETYPREDIKSAIDVAVLRDGAVSLSYCSSRGHERLRKVILKRMKEKFGLDFGMDEILVTAGSQQGLDMVGKLFLEQGDVCIFEAPAYLGAVNALQFYEADFVAIPTDDEGMVINELRWALEKYGSRVKMVYVNPDFQNPTGKCWSEQRRRDFMKLMSKYDIPVVEDTAYTELRFEGEDIPPLASMDKNGQVIYMGTFSKIFAPGFRVAWVLARKDILDKLLAIQNAGVLSTSTLCQIAVASYVEEFDLEEHVKEINDLYRARRDNIVEAIDKYFPDCVKYQKPSGGLFIWLELPEGADTNELLEDYAEKKQVSFIPGTSFYPEDPKHNEMRINFSNLDPEVTTEGIRRLGEAINEYLTDKGFIEA